MSPLLSVTLIGLARAYRGCVVRLGERGSMGIQGSERGGEEGARAKEEVDGENDHEA